MTGLFLESVLADGIIKTDQNTGEERRMGSFSEILKTIREAKNIEVGEDEAVRVRITISHGKIEAITEVVPDLDALSLEQLYELQEEYEARVDEMTEAEPDEAEDPEEYENWEKALDQLEEDLDDVNEKIDELLEEEEEEDGDDT